MANVRTPVLHGITECGEDNGTQVPWGATEQNGVSIAIDGEDVDVISGQAYVLEDSFPSTRAVTVTMRLQYSGLLNLQDALGLPSTALTGDLGAATPTDEVLAIEGGELATEEKKLYAIHPGPVSTRLWEFERCKQRGGFTMELASNDYIKLETSWGVLANSGGAEVTVTDAAS
jgi:hypothetical protein